MAKFKIKYVKFVYTPKHLRGNDWATPPEAKIGFGNRHTDEYNNYMFHGNHISTIFSDYLEGDKRKWDNKAKFTESEASILLLQYLEDKLKDCRKSKKQLDSMAFYHDSPMTEYSRKVNQRELAYNTEACKIWRKKVREIKKSKEYMWEQLSK